MKLNDMTAEQKSRWIAEKAGWTELQLHPVLGWTGKPPADWKYGVEAGGCIPNMVHDDAMTLMLKQKLSQTFTLVSIRYENHHIYVEVGSIREVALGTRVFVEFRAEAETEGIAVADVFMLASGFQEE